MNLKRPDQHTPRERTTRSSDGFRYLIQGLLFAVAAGCVPDRPIRIELNNDVQKPTKSVIIFLVDGMDRTRLRELLAEGKLPNIEQRFVKGGVQVTRAVTSLPSITYPNCSTVITGCYPGHHGILGNCWLDRSTLSCYNMNANTYLSANRHLLVPTLFDHLSDHFTLSIQAYIRQGVTHAIDNPNMIFWCWAFERYMDLDRHVSLCMEEATGVANQAKRWPTVIFTYYPGVDEMGHKFGPDSLEYETALVNIDRAIKRIGDALDEAGVGPSTYYALVADHSMAPVAKQHQFDLLRWLRKSRGIHPRTTAVELGQYADRAALLQQYDTVVALGSGRVGMIYFPGERGWSQPPKPEKVEEWVTAEPAITSLPAVEFVITKTGPDQVCVRSHHGSAIIQRRPAEPSAQYRLIADEKDILRYRTLPKLAAFVDRGWHTSREWLDATIHTHHPDFVAQVVEMFDSPRAGDIVVMAADDWSFEPNYNYKGGHGSCIAPDMLIPMYFAGPDLPRGGTIATARLVDFMPTLLGLLGEQDRLQNSPPIDGINLAAELKNARPQAGSTKTGKRTNPRPVRRTP